MAIPRLAPQLVPHNEFKEPFEPRLRMKRGIYDDYLTLLAADPAKALKFSADDKSTLTQLQTRARQRFLILMYSRQDHFVGVRVFRVTDGHRAILQQLPKKIEHIAIEGVNARAEIRRLAEAGLAQLGADNVWSVTKAGLDQLVAPSE